jgi:hypothetical protein
MEELKPCKKLQGFKKSEVIIFYSCPGICCGSDGV